MYEKYLKIHFLKLSCHCSSASIYFSHCIRSRFAVVRGEDVREENVQDVSMRCFFSLRLFK